MLTGKHLLKMTTFVYRLCFGPTPRMLGRRKKRENFWKPFVISYTQQVHVASLSNQICLPLIISGNCYKLILYFLSSLYSPFSSKRNLYFFTPGKILKKIIKHAACKHLEKSVNMNSILWGFVKNKYCHNNIVFIHGQIASSTFWGKHYISYSFSFVRFLKLSLKIQNTTLRIVANSTWWNGMNDSNAGVKWAILQGSITINILFHDI